MSQVDWRTLKSPLDMKTRDPNARKIIVKVREGLNQEGTTLRDFRQAKRVSPGLPSQHLPNFSFVNHHPIVAKQTQDFENAAQI